ncbi:MAG: biotin transporter BioY [Ruminococcaceae bacterium]|nr:biotin transporter BioY [Oscillospiraceae bacterium]
MRKNAQKMVMIALMAGILAILSPITLPLGPIPFTLGLLGVFFISAMQPPAAAMASIGVYILLGVIGLPVFSGFRGGPQVLAGPTGGYLLGYFLIALAISLATKYSRRIWVQILAGLAGLALCYGLGTVWFVLVSGTDFLSGLMLCVVPFIAPDVIKMAAALLLARLLARRLNRGRST